MFLFCFVLKFMFLTFISDVKNNLKYFEKLRNLWACCCLLEPHGVTLQVEAKASLFLKLPRDKLERV